MKDRFNDQCLERYYASLAKVKILSASEEKEVFTKYQARPTQGLRKRIVESCLKLVFSLAKHYWKDRNPETLKCLISAGNVGLLEAIDKFDLTRGSRFSSYASFWILMHIRNELTGLNDVVRPSAQERKRRMLSAKSRDKHDKKVGYKKTSSPSYTTCFTSGGVELSAPASQTPEAVYSATRSSADLKMLFGNWTRFLRTREQYVIERYYGLGSSPKITLKEIAANLGLSSERVRQIKEESLAKLKHWAEFSGVVRSSDML